MADCFRVTGGGTVRGTIRPAGNKNAALPMIAATLLGDSPTIIHNVPRIRDVHSMLELVEDLGASVEWLDDRSLRLDPTGVRPQPLNREICARIRASILLAGPMLGKYHRVTLPPPGAAIG